MGIVGDWLKKISGHGGDADVLANYDNVEIVTDELKSIATMGVGNAQDAIYAAVNQLNSLQGMAEYVGTVQVSNYDGVFQSISKSINNIADQIQGKAEDIKAYDESTWYEKAFSTATMVLAKGTEGILSVVEDLGDGIVTVAGWVSSNEQFKQNCADFIAKEWSHDALNFYYDSEFAKYSAFTEDSSIAGVVKGAGVVAGYIGAISKTNSEFGPSMVELLDTRVIGLNPETAGAMTQARGFSTVYQEIIEKKALGQPLPEVLDAVLQPNVEEYKKNLKPIGGNQPPVVAGRFSYNA